MSTNYPGSLDSYTTKNAGDTVSENHVNNLQDAVVAVETKVGTGSSTATADKVLRGTANGATLFGQIDTGDIANGTDGELITWNAAGAAAVVAVGTATQVLKSNGAGAAPTFQDNDVSQTDLKTDMGEVSTDATTITELTLPGGEYGFYPQTKSHTLTDGTTVFIGMSKAFGASWHMSTSYETRIFMSSYNQAGYPMYAQQRYVTASGKDHWIFLLVDKETGKISSSYQAPDHPSANQGGATEIELAHPFGNYDSEKYEVVVVDNVMLNIAKSRINRRRSLLTVINEDFIIDDTKRPQYQSREIIKINEFPDEPIGEVVKRIKTPQWAKIMIQAEEITLERKIVENLPGNISYKEMALK